MTTEEEDLETCPTCGTRVISRARIASILALIKEGPISAVDLSKKLKCHRSTITRATSRLVRMGAIARTLKNLYYEPGPPGF